MNNNQLEREVLDFCTYGEYVSEDECLTAIGVANAICSDIEDYRQEDYDYPCDYDYSAEDIAFDLMTVILFDGECDECISGITRYVKRVDRETACHELGIPDEVLDCILEYGARRETVRALCDEQDGSCCDEQVSAIMHADPYPYYDPNE